MTTVQRQDNITFIVPDYRERLTNKKASLLLNEVSILSKSYGNLIYIQKTKDNAYEVAFSEDSGYLLAESVAKHLHASDNFIYIEPLKDSDNLLFIVVKEGHVYIDSLIPADTLSDELIIIQTEQTEFDFYVHGDLNITNDEAEADKFYVGNIASQYHVLDDSVFDALIPDEAFALRPVKAAFSNANLSKPVNKRLVIAAAAVVIIAICWLMWPSSTTQQSTQPEQIVTVKSKFYDYAKLLKSPGPTKELNGTIRFLTRIQDLPAGWQVKSVAIKNKNITVTLKGFIHNPNYETLYDWASAKNIQMTINTSNVTLRFNTDYRNRGIFHKIYPTQEVLRIALDRVKPLLVNGQFDIGETKYTPHYTNTSVSISFSNISLSTLNTLSEQFSDLPVLFKSASLVKANYGLYSGSINIQIVGEKQ